MATLTVRELKEIIQRRAQEDLKALIEHAKETVPGWVEETANEIEAEIDAQTESVPVTITPAAAVPLEVVPAAPVEPAPAVEPELEPEPEPVAPEAVPVEESEPPAAA